MPKKSRDDDSDYSTNCNKQSKVSIKTKKQIEKSSGILAKNQGKWNVVQKRFYIQFLQLKTKQINDQNYRKQMKIFKQMSIFMKSRTPDQCRSHHQKIIKLHRSTDNIFKVYQNREIIIKPLNLVKNSQNIDPTSLQMEDMPTKGIKSRKCFSFAIKNDILQIEIHDDMIAEY